MDKFILLDYLYLLIEGNSCVFAKKGRRIPIFCVVLLVFIETPH